MFILGMVMSCDIISGITCMFYFLCKIVVIIKINKFIYYSYIVRITSVNDIMLINSSIINKDYNVFSLHYAFYLFYSYKKPVNTIIHILFY